MEYSIRVNGLTHRFGERIAVDHLTFDVPRGEVFALLGPNGAGKTTTVRLLNGMYTQSEGSVSVLGFDPAAQGVEVRRRSGVLTETPALYERLTARQNLNFFGTLAGMSPLDLRRRIDELLTFFELQDRADQRVGAYSKGMKQRLALARALLSRPSVLFLDEPTSGLDPESALQVRELIQSIRQRDGHTVFLCTHHLDEAQRLCDRVAIMNHGRFLAVGTLAELARRISPGLWIEVELLRAPAAPLPALSGAAGVLRVNMNATSVQVQVESREAIPAVVTRLAAAGAEIVSVKPQDVSLEDVYFKLQQEAEGR